MSNKIPQSLNKADGMDRDSSKVLPLSMDPFSSSLRTAGLRSQEGDLEEEGRNVMELAHLM